MKSCEGVNMKEKSKSTSKLKKRKKFEVITSKSQDLTSPKLEENHSTNKNQTIYSSTTKSNLQYLNKCGSDNHESDEQREYKNTTVKIKLKRGRKSNKDKLQMNSVILGRNQSDLQTFVQRKSEQSKENKTNVDGVYESIEHEEHTSESQLKSRKNDNRKRLKNKEKIKAEGNDSKEKLQINDIILEKNQSDLQTFVHRKPKQSEESKANVDEKHSSEKNGKNYKRKKLKKQGDIKSEENVFNLMMNNSIENDNNEKIINTEQKNAFEVMMESRNKVIGRNSPGKDFEISKVDDKITESKLKLFARKSVLQEWANAKGGMKRKIDEAQKQLCINEKLEMRAKRMKHMLSISLNNKNKSSKRKKVKKIISDSDSSSDETLKKKVIQISENSEECASDTETQVNIIKIKMFSPEVFKRRRCNKQNNGSDNLKNSNLKNEIVDSRTNKNNETVDEDHKNKETINIVSDQEEVTTNVRRSSRKSAKINFHDRDLILLTSEDDDSSDSFTLNKPKGKCKKSKEMKVAPVFLRATPKPKIDPAIIEARKQFLMSGVPDSLKRTIEKQQVFDDIEYDVFPTISHVQQRESESSEQKLVDYWSLQPVNLCFTENEAFSPNLKENSLISLLNYTCDNHTETLTNPVVKMKNVKSILKDIKAKNPDYPVFRTFRLLQEKFELYNASDAENVPVKKKRKSKHLGDRKNKEVNNYILWTEKYKAKVSDDIIGNRVSTLGLKKWLISWVEYSRETKLQKVKDSSGSEFNSSDSESSNNRKNPSNAIILVSPHGSGKMMTIYAICNELQINVLELNASDKRTGKCLLQKLQEASQSYQVRKSESSNSSQYDLNQQVKKEKMCLLVVDDIDVIFDQDEGFLPALAQLLLTSKRPIVLVTTDENCSHLQKFILQYPVIKFTPLSPNVVSVWLQILCLIEGAEISKEVLAELLDWNKGDARRTLLQLQFWIENTDREPLGAKNNTEEKKLNETEKSGHSQLNELPDGDLQEIVVFSNRKPFFINEALTLENLWRSLSSPLNISLTSHSFFTCDDQTKKKNEEFYMLQKCVKVFDTFAISDFIFTKIGLDSCFMEPCPRFFQQNIIKDSTELRENMNMYNDSKEVALEWSNYLVNKQLDVHVESQTKITCLSGQERRWRTKQYNCGIKFLELVSPSYHTDRKAFSLDYFPALRTVARSEKQRAATNNKRGNRFYNYLCTLGYSHKDTVTQLACDIFNTCEDNI